MPRPRLSEMAPRVSTRGPTSHRTSSSDSDPPHHRPITERSPKLGDRRSPKTGQSEPLNQKKLGSRIAGLETQLEQAQEELKLLKNQLALVEVAKKEAQKELENKAIKPFVSEPELVRVPVHVQDPRSALSENEDSTNMKETDVFEVSVETVSKELKKLEENEKCDANEVKVKVNVLQESTGKSCVEEVIGVGNEEVSLLKLKIEEKYKKLEEFVEENEVLKHQLSEANVELTSAKVKEEKLNLKLTEFEQELKKSKNEGIKLSEKLKEVEGVKEVMEAEMRKLRVQTEQWRKAADAAATILAGGGVEVSGRRRVSERCGSMDKHYGGMFEAYGGFAGSGSLGFGDESDDGFGQLKRKGSGIRMFGDLWKKKGHK